MFFHAVITKKKYYIFTIGLIILALFSIFYVKFIFGQNNILFGCLFKNTFHLYCPGCGGTHALSSLLTFHFIQSFLYNPIVLYIVFCLSFFYIKIGVQLVIKKEAVDLYIHLFYFLFAIAILFLFFLIRNVLLVYFGIDYIGELKQYWKK